MPRGKSLYKTDAERRGAIIGYHHSAPAAHDTPSECAKATRIKHCLCYAVYRENGWFGPQKRNATKQCPQDTSTTVGEHLGAGAHDGTPVNGAPATEDQQMARVAEALWAVARALWGTGFSPNRPNIRQESLFPTDGRYKWPRP